jgi:hypothetical protein
MVLVCVIKNKRKLQILAVSSHNISKKEQEVSHLQECVTCARASKILATGVCNTNLSF